MKKLSLAAFLLIAVTAFSLLLSLAMLAAPSGDCGNNITYTVTDGALVLSGSGSMNDYTPSTLPWGDEAVFITSLTIPEGITSIGIDAFLNLSVSKVTIPESVILIGSNALGYSYYEGTYRALSDFTIVGKRGSAAETYATQNGFDFEAISPALPSGSCGQSVTWSLSGRCFDNFRKRPDGRLRQQCHHTLGRLCERQGRSPHYRRCDRIWRYLGRKVRLRKLSPSVFRQYSERRYVHWRRRLLWMLGPDVNLAAGQRYHRGSPGLLRLHLPLGCHLCLRHHHH